MRTITIIIIIFLAKIDLFCQLTKKNKESPLFIEISKIVSSYTEIPNEVLFDSCYDSFSFVKVDFNDKGKFSSIQLSDNSPNWLNAALAKIISKKKINSAALDAIGVKEKLRNAQIVFPLIIASMSFTENRCKTSCTGQQNLFYFNSKKMSGSFIFEDRIAIYFSKPRI